mmetsp:Transcript_18416/g.42053  ORF Transcript_18416/g.42053 Transcript_18416/m.42053 type:complete len:446 (+) Transcript_18416:370-1707(+)
MVRASDRRNESTAGSLSQRTHDSGSFCWHAVCCSLLVLVTKRIPGRTRAARRHNRRRRPGLRRWLVALALVAVGAVRCVAARVCLSVCVHWFGLVWFVARHGTALLAKGNVHRKLHVLGGIKGPQPPSLGRLLAAAAFLQLLSRSLGTPHVSDDPFHPPRSHAPDDLFLGDRVDKGLDEGVKGPKDEGRVADVDPVHPLAKVVLEDVQRLAGGRHRRRVGHPEALEIDDQAELPVAVLGTAGDGLFDRKDQVPHVVGLVEGVFPPRPHVHQRPAGLVVAPDVDLARLVFLAEDRREVRARAGVRPVVAVVVAGGFPGGFPRGFPPVPQRRDEVVDPEFLSPPQGALGGIDRLGDVSLLGPVVAKGHKGIGHAAFFLGCERPSDLFRSFLFGAIVIGHVGGCIVARRGTTTARSCSGGCAAGCCRGLVVGRCSFCFGCHGVLCSVV